MVDVVRNVEAAAEFFETIQMLYNFFSNSVAHDLFIKKQREIESLTQPVELKSLSDTRWACQYAALVAIRKSLPAIRATLLDIMSQPNARRKTEARAVNGLVDEQFVLRLTLFEELFRVTKFMSDQLQSPTLELSSTIDLSESVIATLSDKRAEESWIDIQDRAADLCTKAGVSQDGTCEKRRTQPPRILQEFVVEAPVERTPVTTSDAQRTHLYYPVIDRLVGEMRRRFSTEAGGVLTGVSALSPKHASFLDKKCLQPMAQFYLVTEENLKAELHQIQRLLERKKAQGHVVNDTLEFLALMRPYRDAFVDLQTHLYFTDPARDLCFVRTQFLLPPSD